MDNKINEVSVFQKLTRIGKSPVFIIAVCGYLLYFINNIINSIGVLSSAFDSSAEGFEVAISILTCVLNVVPVLLALLGLCIILYSCIRRNENSLYTGLNILRIFTIIKTIILILVTVFRFISLAGAQAELSNYGANNNNGLFITGTVGIISMIGLYVLEIVFLTMLRKFIVRIWDASYEDSPMPDDGQNVALYMIILGALNAFIALVALMGAKMIEMSYVLVALLPTLGFALAYILFAVTIYMYRAEMTKLYYIKKEAEKKGITNENE